VLKARALQRAAKLSLAPITSLLSSVTPCLTASLGTETPLWRHVRIYHPGYLAHITNRAANAISLPEHLGLQQVKAWSSNPLTQEESRWEIFMFLILTILAMSSFLNLNACTAQYRGLLHPGNSTWV
jgi:hypothetical protein